MAAYRWINSFASIKSAVPNPPADRLQISVSIVWASLAFSPEDFACLPRAASGAPRDSAIATPIPILPKTPARNRSLSLQRLKPRAPFYPALRTPSGKGAQGPLKTGFGFHRKVGIPYLVEAQRLHSVTTFSLEYSFLSLMVNLGTQFSLAASGIADHL